MANRHAAFGFSIELASGWTASIRQDVLSGESFAFLAVVPATNDALLRLTPDERGIMSASKWVEFVEWSNRAKGRRVLPIRCGDLSGCTTEFGTTDEWLRHWALCADSIPLDANYRCKIADAGRDDRVVDLMMQTLRLEKS